MVPFHQYAPVAGGTYASLICNHIILLDMNMTEPGKTLKWQAS